MSAPKVFISSTIYDFKDLRSALKHALEERGVTVMASEYNDFGEVFDEHSYDSCLKNIGRADYFVLFIGSRVGGWYDPVNKISITQQEYREAYKLHTAGKLKIIAFVRADIWQAKEERAALNKHLIKLKKSEKETNAILEYKSKSMNDAKFIRSFIAEVGKNAETKAALKSGGPKPTGNWIYTFSTFKEVIEVMNPLTFFGKSSADAATSKAIQNELIDISSSLILKSKGTTYDVVPFAERFMNEFPIPIDVLDIHSTMDIPHERWGGFIVSCLGFHSNNLASRVLESALTSSLFLKYNKLTHTYDQTGAHSALYKLVKEVSLLNRINEQGRQKALFENVKPISQDSKMRTMSSYVMADLYSTAKRAINILRLSKALYEHLEGKDFQAPTLHALTPISAMEKEFENETVSSEEVLKYFKSL